MSGADAFTDKSVWKGNKKDALIEEFAKLLRLRADEDRATLERREKENAEFIASFASKPEIKVDSTATYWGANPTPDVAVGDQFESAKTNEPGLTFSFGRLSVVRVIKPGLVELSNGKLLVYSPNAAYFDAKSVAFDWTDVVQHRIADNTVVQKGTNYFRHVKRAN